MSDWDFLWELEGEEREFAMETGMSYADLAYLQEQEEKELKRAEKARIKERNKAWYSLKKLRDSGKISHQDFKKRKEEIFAVEIERQKQYKALERQLKEYKKHSIHNRNELIGAVKCVCYSCCSKVLVYHVTYDDNDTAICPVCRRKTILPYLDNVEYYLCLLHDYVFPNEDESRFEGNRY